MTAPAHSSPPRGRMRAIAATTLTLALGLTYGTYDPAGLSLVLLAAVALAVGIASAPGAVSEGESPAREVRRMLGLGLGLGTAVSLLSAPGVTTDPARLGPYPLLVLAMAALALTHARAGLAPSLRTARFLGVLVLFVAISFVVLDASTNPPVDVFQLQQHAGRALLRGIDPFTDAHPNPYPPGSPVLAAEVLSPDGRSILGYPYPPLSLALVAPFAALGDVRFGSVVATVLAAVALRWLGRGRPTADLAATFLLVAPRTSHVLEIGWTEPALLAAILLVAATLRATSRPPSDPARPTPGPIVALGLAFGLLLASKQTALLFAVPLAFLVPPAWRLRVAALACAVVVLTLAPFLLHDAHAVLRGLVTFHRLQPFRPDALTLSAFLHHQGLGVLPVAPSFVLAGLVLLVGRPRVRRVGDALALGALAFLVFVLTNKQAGANYLWLVVGLVAASLAADEGEDEAEGEAPATRPVEAPAASSDAPVARVAAVAAALVALAALTVLPTRAGATGAFTLSLTLEHRAFDLPSGAPSMVVHGGPRFAPGVPFDLVLFLHGYSGCVNVLARTGRVRCTPSSPVESGWGLAAAHDRAGQNTLLVMPQLAYRQRNGDPGRLRQDGFARDMLRETFRAARAQLGGAGLDRVRRIVLAAHSGGFDAATTILEHGRLGPRVKRVVLFDALYGGTSQFLTFAGGAPDRTLVSIYNAGRPAEQTRVLLAGARRDGLRVLENPASLRTSIRRARVTAFHTRVAHGDIPARYFRDVLQF